MIPAWLRTHLEMAGLWDADGISRHARIRRCRQCRHQIIAGLDADLIAGEAYCDPTPLSAHGEAAALILDRRTYALRWTGGHLQVDGPRSVYEIRGHPAGKPNKPGDLPPYDVIAEHACGTLPLPSLPTVHVPPKIQNFDGDPPY